MDVDDNDSPTQMLDHFVELAQVEKMIGDLKTDHNSNFEKSYETFSNILSRYQEQPHLLNPHLPALIEQLLNYIRQADVPLTLFHGAFKYLYQFAKVRTYKIILKFLPHETSDLDFVLNSLEQQNISETNTWETRYMLLIWLSILVLNPFELSRFDGFISGSDGDKPTSKIDRIFKLCKTNTNNNDTCSNVAAFLTAKFLIRIDIKDKYLPQYLDWVCESKDEVHFGKLAAISFILKHGKREDLLVHASKLLTWLLSCDFKSGNDFLKNKYFVKIIQRLGLVFLKPRLATWRYQRGSRSLTAKLAAGSTKDDIEFKHDEITAVENEDDIDVPSEIEEIIEELLQAMRNPSSDIRWSTAKGIGRITSRLPKEFGDEVVGSVIEILNPLEPHEAWHGACLAIAELAKRGLLLPYRLETMVPLLLQALVYDELKGYMSVGQHIRDAACYMCWAIARAYEPNVLKDFVSNIATGLLITTVFDREINCRRAASAAFQESVGRLRTFPHGIDIITKADFFSVGLRTNSYLEISDYIAQYPEYSKPLIDHLIERKVNHWDPAIRELTSKTLNKLTSREPDFMVSDALPKLFSKTSSIDINERHGTVLAIGEIIAKLRELEINRVFINDSLTERLNGLVQSFQQRDQFRGMSGEMMYQCCCDFIRNCSASRIAVSPECIDSWQLVIDSSLSKNSATIRDAAVAALPELCKAYYTGAESIDKNAQLLRKYLEASNEKSWEFVRMGFVAALGALPDFMLKSYTLNQVITTLMNHSLPNAKRQLFRHEDAPDCNITANWAEARKESVKALCNVILTVGYDEMRLIEFNFEKEACMDTVFRCFLEALNEYTIDNRGDIGAWVREASMNALYKLVVSLPANFALENIEKMFAVVSGLLQQAVEKIDRTRALAGKLFCKLIYHDPPIECIQNLVYMKTVFPEDFSNILWLHAAHTFPLFCKLLVLPEYTQRLMIGLIASIGQLTESLVKHSSEALIDFLRNNPEHQRRICDEVIHIFNKNTLNERISYPLLNFLNIIIGSGIIDDIVLDSSLTFSSEVYRLTKLEIKGHKKLYKLISSINVFCQLIQVPELSTKVLSTLSIFLGLPHVHVRKTTATKLYEALILHADACGIPEENLDEIMNYLSETDWGQSITEIRLIRNKLCTLLNIKPPVTAATAKQ